MPSWYDELSQPSAPAAAPPPKTNWYSEMSDGSSVSTAKGAAAKVGAGGIIDDPAKAADVGAQITGSLPTDAATAVRAFATRRFPDMTTEEAVSRYGIRGGRLFYVDRDGKPYYEQTEFRWPTSAANIESDIKATAGSAGSALPVIGGTIGGVATSGFAGGVPGAAAGGAAGDLVRQGLAAATTGEEKPILERAVEAGGAGLQEGAGQAVGLGLVKGATKLGLARTPVYNLGDATDITNKARAVSADPNDPILLTPGEATGSKTLIRRQKVLANTTQGEDTFGEFYQGRNDKIRAAVTKFLDSISPEGDTAVAKRSGVEAAKEVVGQERKALAKQAKPFYDISVNEGVNVPSDALANLRRSPLIRSVIDEVRRDPVYGNLEALPNTNTVVLDLAKKHLDDMISEAKAAGKGNRVRLLTEAKDDLVGLIEEHTPKVGDVATGADASAYKVARNIYEEGMPAVTKVEKGLVGDVAGLEATTNDALKASRILFSPTTSSAKDVAEARDAFFKAGKQAEWYTLVRAHLQDMLESIPESANGSLVNIGGAWRKAVFGNGKKQGILIEALRDNPEFVRNANWLMDVLGATGKATKGESITAFAQAGQREIANESKPLLSSALETVEVWRTPSRVAQFWNDVAAGKYAAKMSQILTSPDGIAKLKELRRLSPTSTASAVALSHLLTASGTAAAERGLFPASDREPTLSDQPQ